MSPLGRGLASLIPRRRRAEAEELIDDIDENAEPNETEETEVAVKEETVVQVAVEKVTTEEAVATPAKNDSGPGEMTEFEQLANDDEKVPMPPKPNVTPLTFDEATGNLVEVSVAKAMVKKATPVIKKTIARKLTTPIKEEAATAEPKKEEPKKSVSKKASKPEKKIVGPDNSDDWLERRVLGHDVKYIPLGDIEVNPEQPRRAFQEEELSELMQSLEQHGMLQPMVVMEKDDGKGYQIIAGERRWRAAKQLGWTEVPCVVRSGVTGDRNRLELALTENVQRENLNPVEEALGYKRLNEEYGMSHEEIGQRVGKSRVAITNVIRILQLPDEIQKGLIDDKITVGHARAILMIPDEDKQVRFYQHVVDEGLTVRKTEIRARNIQRSMNVKNAMGSRPPGRSQFAVQYDAALQNYYGYNAKVKFNTQRNRFEVRFYAHSEKEIDDLVQLLLRRKEMPKNVDSDVLED